MENEYSKQSIGTSNTSSDQYPTSSMETNDISAFRGSTNGNDTLESRPWQEINSNETPHFFVNKPIRRGKWTPEEERYAKAIIEAFDEGTLQGVENGCTLRSYLSVKLHCAPMRISKKFAGKSIGKNVFLLKAPNTSDSEASTSNAVQETMNKIRRLEQQFNISLLQEEGPMTRHLELVPSTFSNIVPVSAVSNRTASDTNHMHPLSSLLLQPPYRNIKTTSTKQIQVKAFDAAVSQHTGQNQSTENQKYDAITDLFKSYQKAQIYHGVQLNERDNDNSHHSKGNGVIVSDSRTDKDSLVTEHDKQVWWNETAALLVSMDKASNNRSDTLPFDAQGVLPLKSNLRTDHSDSNANSSTFWSKLKDVSKINSSDSSNASSNKPRHEILEPVSFSAADEYAMHARQSVIEVSHHSAYCKTSVQSKTNQDNSEHKDQTTTIKDDSRRRNHAFSVNKDLGSYSIISDDIQQTGARLKSKPSQLVPHTVSGSDRSSDNYTNPYDGSSGTGSQNGISIETSDMDNSDTGSDEASISKKKHKVDVAILHNSEPLQKRVK